MVEARPGSMIPPAMTNALPWSRGYFEFVRNEPLRATDVLRQHCFRDVRGWFFDETGRRLDEAVEPVGTWDLHSYRTIDDEISLALGLPLSEEQD